MLTRNTQKLVWPPKMQCGVMQSKVTSSSRSSTGGSSIHGGVPLDRAASTKWAYVCKPKTVTANWEYNSNTDQVDCSCKPKEHFFFFLVSLGTSNCQSLDAHEPTYVADLFPKLHLKLQWLHTPFSHSFSPPPFFFLNSQEQLTLRLSNPKSFWFQGLNYIVLFTARTGFFDKNNNEI